MSIKIRKETKIDSDVWKEEDKTDKKSEDRQEELAKPLWKINSDEHHNRSFCNEAETSWNKHEDDQENIESYNK